MRRYPLFLIERICKIRAEGKSISEIKVMYPDIPNSTLNHWFKHVRLNDRAKGLLKEKALSKLDESRKLAVNANRIKRSNFLDQLSQKNVPLSMRIDDSGIAKIALAMLCLGEASKYNPKTRSAFSLGNSNPKIIFLFLDLLKRSFNFDLDKVRCTVQCRADQDPLELRLFWSNITNIPLSKFYKAQVDKRTFGKPTRKTDYKGVLRVDYFDTKVQLELETIANLIYNHLSSQNGPLA